MKKRLVLALASSVLLVPPALYAVGIPVPDLTSPLKVSMSDAYKCNDKGQAFTKLKGGNYTLMEGITCHDDNLWRKGKAMTFIDMVNYIADEYYNASMVKQHLSDSEDDKKDM
ncbi:hypothetical protein [Pantoea sp. CFSAN033090]|uniref:hypothetical protein n=1 Tax=Pantoea sp. CFSAN033090 TaxID=1690502 RepID=UPI0012E0D2E3|nr:hypothetical protein [Pantoea sp. CFSAN033090]